MPTLNRSHRLLFNSLAALLLGLAAACSPTPSLPPTSQAIMGPVTASHRLTGRVEFPERTVQLTAGGVLNQATVSLLNPANQVVAVGRTDALGAFALDPGTAFAPSVGDLFVLEAYKTATTGGLGGDVVRLRTVVQWEGAAWNSTSGATILVNAATTAVCIIQDLSAGAVSARDTLGAVTGASVTSPLAALRDPASAVGTLILDLLAKDRDPVSRIAVSDGRYHVRAEAMALLKLERFVEGGFADTTLDASGYLQLGGPKPQPRDAASELAYFQAAGMNNDGAGVIATDGTYLYVKAWSNYANTTADAHVYKKIGTGYNGSNRGQNYGKVGGPSPSSTTAFYWNGGLYCNTGNAGELYRVDASSGAATTVPVNAATLMRHTGTPGPGSLYACDGTYVYNLTYRIDSPLGNDSGTPTEYNGFTVQVLNPANNFSLVRQFTMDTTSYYTDGLFCDGTYLYPIEWRGNGTPARIRRYRLSDGVREAETTFMQTLESNPYNPSANDPISGSWDPVNKVFWIGNLTNDSIHLLRGGSFHPGGSYTSQPLDSQSGAPQYGRLNWTATTPAGTSLSFKVRSAQTLADLAAATWYGPTGTGDAYTATATRLNPVHSKHRYLQVQVTLASTDLLQTPKLQTLGVEVLP